MKFSCAVLLFSMPLFASTSDFKFGHESELSIVNTGGNSQLETYNAKTVNTLKKERNKFELSGHYTYGKSDDVASARNWSALARYDRFTSDILSVFLAEKIEGNKFQGLESRYNTDLGLSYMFFETKNSSLQGEVGYRYTYEKSTDSETGSENFQKGRLYLEHWLKLNETVRTRFWVEYLPNFTESEEYIFSFEPSLRVSLNSIFSLSVAYKGVYENEPAAIGRKKYDYMYTTSLIARF